MTTATLDIGDTVFFADHALETNFYQGGRVANRGYLVLHREREISGPSFALTLDDGRRFSENWFDKTKTLGAIKPEMYLVGGAVRDRVMTGEKVYKDLDFVVVADSYEEMRDWLILEWGVEIFVEHQEFHTIRGRFTPEFIEGSSTPFSRHFYDYTLGSIAADFVLARKDGEYEDGRRPLSVESGTLLDDLKRRDFTVNAMALSKDGVLIDPFGGATDAREPAVLRAVGKAVDRFYEDALRAVRAIRFMVTKNMAASDDVNYALRHVGVLKRLEENIAVDRIREELARAFRHDTLRTLSVLSQYPDLSKVVLSEIWLKPTSEDR